jgi:hypothetical protein
MYVPLSENNTDIYIKVSKDTVTSGSAKFEDTASAITNT